MGDACETMGERVSAYHDGELRDAERVELERHLAECHACRRRRERFAAIDRSLNDTELEPPLHPMHLEERIAHALHEAPVRGDRSIAWPRLIRVAAAAVVVLAVGMLVLVTSDRADAGRTAVPLATLELLQRDAAGDQRAMLKTMEWELRALRLELGRLDVDEENRSPVLSRIDRLLERVRAPDALDQTERIERIEGDQR